MLQTRRRVWFSHRYKEEWTECPLCGEPIVWKYDGEGWIPCDWEPILFKNVIGGALTVCKGRELKENCELYNPGDKELRQMGFLPHVYSCEELPGYHGVKVDRWLNEQNSDYGLRRS